MDTKKTITLTLGISFLALIYFVNKRAPIKNLTNIKSNNSNIIPKSLDLKRKSAVKADTEMTPDFKIETYLKTSLSLIPKKKILKNITEQTAHDSSSIMAEISNRLGDIKTLLKSKPEYRPQIIKFYEECANDQDGFNSIRSLCLANLIYLNKEDRHDIDISAYPESVVELAYKALELPF